MDREVVKWFAEQDQLFEQVCAELRWCYANLDDAGEAVGKAINQARDLLVRQHDNPQLILRLLEIGTAKCMERINRPSDD